MAAITDYASLTTAINDWTERGYSASDTDGFIGLAEAEFRLYFGPNFAKDASTTLAFTAGSATLPTGLVRVLSLVHTTYGALTEASVGSIRERRVWDTGVIPDIFAVTGTTILTGPVYTGNLTLDYEGTLTGLSGSNTTNWLITNAPQAYLSMCIAQAKLRDEDFTGGALHTQKALQTLKELGFQSMVATHGRSGVRIPGMTP